MKKVVKFGGSSLASAEQVQNQKQMMKQMSGMFGGKGGKRGGFKLPF